MASPRALLQSIPWAIAPIIINAPMSGVATKDLACAVTSAGGLGFIGFDDPRHLNVQLEEAKSLFKNVTVPSGVLPIGVGIIALNGPPSTFLPVFAKHKPTAVWLSFGEAKDFSRWSTGIRSVSPNTKVWIQVGSVSAAVQAAKACQPDVIVLQGSDAGGHGHARGSSIVTLVPEVVDTLAEHGIEDLPLVAAGGIMDGRSAAAAIMLGASGVVMGTRFLGANEAKMPEDYRREILRATDGGEATVRSTVFDEMWSANAWPDLYDGRCLRNACYDDVQNGLSIDQMRVRLYNNIYKNQNEEVDAKDVSSFWAGSGVGMVKKLERAGDIVEDTRNDTRNRLANAGNWS
ncbi:2-nitropropane dioxygenase precursor [Penicillium angulare]|uniref:2-nitropropane dioxygenase n=1 Tax=Penicillium angulare TaxID=116970 RepID=A0A9W9FAL5_9EURO|nr:2-nitropropane dioxygenase precursor [Penicillium angulare]